ncbi:hypothetical protein [Streptomyces sp. 147326]|uniref:hypothetical protein n=1 Tax=Streptomyces sp. 147326 TaxID=3074379 RepID=UPI00385787D3
MLDVLEHGFGWVGHVQLVTGRPASDIDKAAAAAAIEDAYDLLPGSVVVDSGGSGAEIWVYERPSAARHHGATLRTDGRHGRMGGAAQRGPGRADGARRHRQAGVVGCEAARVFHPRPPGRAEARQDDASAGSVLRRSKAHAAAGLSPNWITHDGTFHLVDRSNWMLTNQATWREISNAADLALVGGYRVLAKWHCVAAAQRPCPDGKAKTGCGKVHLQWDTPRRMDGEASGWTSYDGDVTSVTVGISSAPRHQPPEPAGLTHLSAARKG